MPAVRMPAVAGSFYPASKTALVRAIEECFTSRLGPGAMPEVSPQPLAGPVLLVAPHAGYMYSGPTAAWGYSELAKRGRPEVAVIVGPNHRGLTSADTIEVTGAWETPLGRTPIAEDVASKIASSCRHLKVDPRGSSLEHSLEVHLPFLQVLYGTELPVVPIMVSSRRYETLAEIGVSIARAVPKATVIIASTDMTHFRPAAVAKSQDTHALSAVEALDGRALAEVVTGMGISMCGWAATVVGIEAAHLLGISRYIALRYSTSGDITGDMSDVVAYASGIAE